MSIIDPAANHMEEVHSDCEVQALLPSTDEEPQTKGAVRTVRQKGFDMNLVNYIVYWCRYKDAPARCSTVFNPTSGNFQMYMCA